SPAATVKLTAFNMVNRPSGLLTALPRSSTMSNASFPEFVMLRSVLWLILLMPAFPAPAGEEPPAPTVLIVGDSLSAGYGLRPGEGWVSLLERKLEAEGYPHRVVNASIS